MDVLNNLDLLRDLTGAMNSSHLPVEALTEYLRKGGDPNTHYVMSLLSQACYVGHLEMVKILLDAGAKPNFAGKSGKLPLYVAAKNQKPGNLEIVELLIGKGADVNCKHVTGSTPLLEAVLANDEIKTAMLIKAGANIFDSNNGGETGLHISAMKGNVKIMKMFINAGVPANALKRHGPASSLYTGTQPLHLTVVGPNGGHAEAATLLLNSGANVDATEWNGRTTLHLAAIRNAYRVVDVLIAHGCGLDPISLDNDEQKTPLMKAIDLGHHVIVEKLIAAGARLDTTDHYGTTPLVTAVFTGKPLVVQLLLRAGCDVNLAIPNGATPFRASLRHAPCITEMLVLAGCRVPRDFSSNITGPFPLANYPSLLEWLIWYSFNPPSLQFCCRSLIRNALGFRPAEKLDWLSPSPIPFRVKEFLLCDDLDDVIDRYSDTTKETPPVDSS